MKKKRYSIQAKVVSINVLLGYYFVESCIDDIVLWSIIGYSFFMVEHLILAGVGILRDLNNYRESIEIFILIHIYYIAIEKMRNKTEFWSFSCIPSCLLVTYVTVQTDIPSEYHRIDLTVIKEFHFFSKWRDFKEM